MAEASVGTGNQGSPEAETQATPTTEQVVQSVEQSQAEVEASEINPAQNEEPSQVTDEQWRAMFDLVLSIYEYREPEYACSAVL